MIEKCYDAEKTDGLESAIASTSPITSLIPLKADSISTDDGIAIAFADDLFNLTTLMVSSGLNKNDDVALSSEIWNARHTPVNKPFNIEHIPDSIIGHITASRVVDDDYNVIADDTAVESLPLSLHIITDAVIYRHLSSRNPKLTAFASELIEQIKNGEWFVSMECLFTDFDYAYIEGNQVVEIVSRNEGTAFLTKHLRAYGGNGVYDNRRIGRVFKNVTYSGKGLVRTPANPDSIIFDTNNEQQELEIANMDEKLQAELAQANSTVASKDQEISKIKAEIEALTSKATQLETKLADVETAKASVEASLTETQTKLTEVEASLTEAQAKLAEQEMKNIAIARVTTLVDKGIEKARAEELVTKYASLNDELFAGIVELVSASKVEVEVVAEAGAEEDEAGEESAEAADINNTEVEADPALTADVTKDGSELRSALAGYFEARLNNNKK